MRSVLIYPFMNGKAVVLAVLAIVLLLIGVGAVIYDMTGPSYTWTNEVHGHMENAYYADDPELMKTELEYAIEGMYYLDLTDEMYGAYFPWEKTVDRRMSYQYDHLEGIVRRIDAVIEWRDTNYGPNASGTPESLGDVYEEKMDNLREFLQEDGWSDWIGEDTFYVNHHIMLFLGWWWYGPLWIIWLISLLCVAIKDNWINL